MNFFGFFNRRKVDSKQSRFEYLTSWKHENLEQPVKTWGNINKTQLIERQLSDGELDLAINNVAWSVRDNFELSNLYWGNGNTERAKYYLEKTLEWHRYLIRLCSTHDMYIDYYPGDGFALVAAFLLDQDHVALDSKHHRTDGRGSRISQILGYCINEVPFDLGAWQTAEDRWIKDRLPKYMLAEDEIYRKALTGEYASAEDMLSAHKKMFKGRAKRANANSGLLDGYNDNDLIIDYVFACVLKRIGWTGRYRHSWPHTDTYESVGETQIMPDRFLDTKPAPIPQVSHESGIISDAREARRFIDYHLRDQKDEDGNAYSPLRSAKTRSKVSGALRDLGWVKDPESLDLMRTYELDRILNSSTHLFLCDPVKSGLMQPGGLKAWTELMADYGLHEDFIAITESEEKSDYMDPQGSWYVYWKKDQKIYAIDREEWHDPDLATNNARLGLSIWPSYTSFVAWWTS